MPFVSLISSLALLFSCSLPMESISSSFPSKESEVSSSSIGNSSISQSSSGDSSYSIFEDSNSFDYGEISDFTIQNKPTQFDINGNASITERNKVFEIKKGDMGSLFSLKQGGYFTNKDPLTYVSGIKVSYERKSDFGSLFYRTSQYYISSPNNATSELPNGEVVTFKQGAFPYFALYAAVGEFDISSISVFTSQVGAEGLSSDIDIYSINDTHGAVDYNVSGSSKQIGVSRLGSYFRDVSSANPDGSVILSSGDMWQGSADSNLTHGRIMNEWMNLVGFESMAIGNHEFDWKIEKIIENAREANFPFLGINIRDENGNQPSWAKSSVTIERQGIRIGIIGAIGKLESSIAVSSLGGYSFESNYPALVKKEADRLRSEEGCSLVFLSIHNASFATEQCHNIDAVFEGHSHTYRNDVDQYGIPHVQCYANGSMVQHLRFSKGDDGRYHFVKSDSVDYSIAPSLPTYKPYEELYSYFKEVIDSVKNEVVGHTSSGYSREEIGNIGAESLYEYVHHEETFNAYQIDASFINTAGVRQAIGKGDITFGEIYAAFPFDNYNDICSLKGRNLRNFLTDSEHYYSYYEDGFLDSINDNETYYIVTLSFVSESKYGSTLTIKQRDDYYLRNVVADYFRGEYHD